MGLAEKWQRLFWRNTRIINAIALGDRKNFGQAGRTPTFRAGLWLLFTLGSILGGNAVVHSPLEVGVHSIRAVYQGTADFSGSCSSVQMVKPQ